MAIEATFDMPLDDAVKKVTAALDDLHEVTYSVASGSSSGSGDSDTKSSKIDVHLDEAPTWVYPAAAFIAAGPWLIAAFTSLVEVTISSTEGIDATADFGDSSVVLLVGAIAVIACLVAAFYLVTSFKRPVYQATIEAVDQTKIADDVHDEEIGDAGTASGSTDVTGLSLTGGAERYVHMGIRRCFDEFDRDEILKRSQSAAPGSFSIREFMELGPRGRGGAAAAVAAEQGASASTQDMVDEQTDEELGR